MKETEIFEKEKERVNRTRNNNFSQLIKREHFAESNNSEYSEYYSILCSQMLSDQFLMNDDNILYIVYM